MVIYSVTTKAVYASKMTLFMETIILDTLQAQNWWLCKVSLWDYLEAVKPSTAFDFEIQRGIVKNIYLDTILDSIVVGEPFPPLTLLVENPKIESSSLIIDDFYILDGLQRTYRLWIYKQIIDMAKAKDLFGPSWRSLHDVISEMRQRFPEATQVIPYAVLQKIFSAESNIFLEKLEQAFKDFNLYLYIWGNLSEKEVVNKMLLLNAGQMRVSLQHQYELMFLRVFSDLNIPITLVRTKDSDYMDVKRGIRQPGQFLFTTLVIGLRSFIECKPVRLDRKFNLNDEECISEEDASFYFDKKFLEQFLGIIYQFDKKLSSSDEAFKKWIVKDTSISSVLGAVGYCIRQKCNEENEFRVKTIQELKTILFTIFGKSSFFKLVDFERQYSRLSSVRINIGSVLRKAIFNYSKCLIDKTPITWEQAFLMSNAMRTKEENDD